VNRRTTGLHRHLPVIIFRRYIAGIQLCVGLLICDFYVVFAITPFPWEREPLARILQSMPSHRSSSPRLAPPPASGGTGGKTPLTARESLLTIPECATVIDSARENRLQRTLPNHQEYVLDARQNRDLEHLHRSAQAGSHRVRW